MKLNPYHWSDGAQHVLASLLVLFAFAGAAHLIHPHPISSAIGVGLAVLVSVFMATRCTQRIPLCRPSWAALRADRERARGEALAEKRVKILRIGNEVAAFYEAFGCKVIRDAAVGDKARYDTLTYPIISPGGGLHMLRVRSDGAHYLIHPPAFHS